jgi:hypothetical protein
VTLLKGHYQLLLLAILIFALWSTPLVLPLKLLIVFLHELSHGAAAVLTGGEIVSLDVSAQEGGTAMTRGGNRFITISAGYVGSLLIGMALLVAALKSKADRAVMAGLGLLTLAVTVLYMRQPFALAFGLATGAAMLAAAYWLGHAASDLALRVIGLSSMIYVPYDIFSDTIARSHLRSDARIMAEEIGGPTLFWGALWLVLSLAAIALMLRRGLGADSNVLRRRARPE